MRDFLSDYVFTLSGKRQQRVYDILAAARIGKEDLDSIAKRLTDFRMEAPIVIAGEDFGSLIRAGKFDGMNRDVYRRMVELFEASNLVSLLLDSYANVLASEIKGIEDEILAMEKAIHNYAFTLADNGAYDYAFTEPFNDDTMRETVSDVKLTDRSGINFASDELAQVNSASGILTLSPSLAVSYSLTGSISASNCIALATSDTGLSNALNSISSSGWRLAIASPRPVSSSIPGAKQQGAQVELELNLSSTAPCDSLLLTPFADMPVEVHRVYVYSSDDQATAKEVLNIITTLDKPITVNFPLQGVSKVRILLNQPIYMRGQLPPNKAESVYRDFYTSFKQSRDEVSNYTGKTYSKDRKALKRVFLKTQRNSDQYAIFKAETPQIDFESTYGPMTIDKIVKGSAQLGGPASFFNEKFHPNTFMRRMIDEKIFANNAQILNDRYVLNASSHFLRLNSPLGSTMLSGTTQEYPRPPEVQPPPDADILGAASVAEQQYLDYQYNLGLRNIQIGYGVKSYRGVFITKTIPAPTDSGEVKLKVDDTNYDILDTSRDSTRITSIEYSISNKSTTQSEQDWLPILPIDKTEVEAERLFVNEAGVGRLRFEGALDKNFVLYKNGYRQDTANVTQINTTDNQALYALQIPIGTYTTSDIFTVDYTPFGTPNVINFNDKGFGQSLLSSAHDDNGAGQTFSSTADSKMVSLDYEPYVDYESVKTFGSYSTTLGFVGTYQPITIVMSDGTVALNQTNYGGLTQNSLASFDSSTYAYIHSGRNIIFNQAINQRFTIYYQYIPSNLRVRMVLRVNDINYVSPSINSIQVKSKTLKSDPGKQF